MFTYEPLNLYTNYAQAVEKSPQTAIILDRVLPAFPDLPLETTYGESLTHIQERAYQLASLGVSQGDKVVLFKSPTFDTYLLAVAVSFLGAIPVMISYHFPATTMDVFVERLDNPYILYDQVTESTIQGVSLSSEDKLIALDRLLSQPAKVVPQSYLADDAIAYMTHTSGTTGIPKLICHSAQSMGWRTTWQRHIFEKIKPKGLLAFFISPVHSRYNIGISSAMYLGFPLMPLNSADTTNLGRMLETYQPLALETHPNNFVQWAFFANNEPHHFQSIRYYHSTFDAINNLTMARFLNAGASDALFLQVYGQSECGPMILKKHTLDSLATNNARDMGMGLAGLTQGRITDDSGNPLPVNTNGHIQFLSKGRALTYYQEDQRFQENVYGDWWDSGDYGLMDEQGHIILKDRQVDLIENVDSNLALEDYLLDQLNFLEEVVIVRDPMGYPQPILAVASGYSMDWDRWWDSVRDLPHLNEPIIKVFEAIPRTATMKVQRLAIESQLKAGTF